MTTERERVIEGAKRIGTNARALRHLVAAYLDECARDHGEAWLRTAELHEQADALRMDYDGDDVDRLARAVEAMLVAEVDCG